MKNYIKGIITGIIIGAAMCPTSAFARVTGTVLSTNIGTVIDGAACKTYNVDGRTFVIAEDLRGYGFDVDWNENTRNLSITQNPYAHRTLLSEEETNIKKEDCPVGNPLMDILSSDVTVTVAGENVEGYNIDGQMVIPVRALEPYAYIEFDEENRLVKIQGLKHYLDTRYSEGNPNTTRDIKEYVQHVFDEQRTLGGGLYSQDSYDVNVKEIATTDTENGKLYSYFGNPLTTFSPTSLNHFEKCYDREIYSITGANGEWLYEADVLGRNGGDFNYIISSDHAQRIGESTGSLYGYTVRLEKYHPNTWPSDEVINKPDLRFEKLTANGAISVDGYLYRLKSSDDSERHMERCNIADEIEYDGSAAFIARDGVVFLADYYYANREKYASNSLAEAKMSSMFDTEVTRGVKKADRGYVLYQNGDLYLNGNLLLSGVYDMAPYYNDDKRTLAVCVLYENGDAYIGDYNDYKENRQKKLAVNVKKVYGNSVHYDWLSQDVHYITDDNVLHEYSVYGDSDKVVAESVSELINEVSGEDVYITTDGVLKSNKKEMAADIKDARYYMEYEVVTETNNGKETTTYKTRYIYYIIKNDGTLWCWRNKELFRVKAFE